MLEKDMNEKQKILSRLPAVDEILKSSHGSVWLDTYPKRHVIHAIREVIDLRRHKIMEGLSVELSAEGMVEDIEQTIKRFSSYSLSPLINATGIVIHTNLGRSVLCERALENIKMVSENYSNLEYNLEGGKRGKRYIHIKRILRELTSAEDVLAVNNNAAAVLLCLNTFSKGKEVLVSRGELVEIGGSFRMPEIMAASGATLREIGTTNKTHLFDYEKAITENTALILKVHKSNFRLSGFTDEVLIEDLVHLGSTYHIPVMFDLGSGCLLDLKPFGIHTEPAVKDIVQKGVDITTFSGDKLLGGPQGGLIVGKREYIERIQKNPLTRAMRIDKLTLAGFEATLMEYSDEENAKKNIPTIKMLLQKPEEIRERAKRIARRIKREITDASIHVMADFSRAGGGSLPEVDLPTYVVLIKYDKIPVNELVVRLRKGTPPIIARIKEDSLVLDARTIMMKNMNGLIEGLKSALSV
jgi:L-seryl-tRNA(Ser) seleniumtransferase